MTARTPVPGRCGERHPVIAGTLCTRAPDHAGGHLDEATGRYWEAGQAQAQPTSTAGIIHYLGRTEADCIAAGQTSICQGCAALGHPQGPSRPWGAESRRDAMTEWREELGYDPITGEQL